MASRANALRAWSAAVVDGGDDSLAGVASRLLERTVHDTASIAAALRAGATAVAARRLRMADDEVGAKSVLLWFSTSEHCARRQQHVQQILALAPNLQQELMTTIQEQMAAEKSAPPVDDEIDAPPPPPVELNAEGQALRKRITHLISLITEYLSINTPRL